MCKEPTDRSSAATTSTPNINFWLRLSASSSHSLVGRLLWRLLLYLTAPYSQLYSPFLPELVALEKSTSLYLRFFNGKIWMWIGFSSAKMVLIPGSFL